MSHWVFAQKTGTRHSEPHSLVVVVEDVNQKGQGVLVLTVFRPVNVSSNSLVFRRRRFRNSPRKHDSDSYLRMSALRSSCRFSVATSVLNPKYSENSDVVR